MMKISKNIRPGDVVTLRGDKLIRASRQTRKILGVFTKESTIGGFALSGEHYTFHIPAGIRTYGEAEVRVKEVK